jgi:non-canonical purine NTP pyrophosphatase (RdgB/HAM1 family)
VPQGVRVRVPDWAPNFFYNAAVVKLVDTRDSKSRDSNIVRVQVSPAAPQMRMWRNWYTRYLEVVVGLCPWRFKSSRAHHQICSLNGSLFVDKIKLFGYLLSYTVIFLEMNLFFVTSNTSKLIEARSFFPEIDFINRDLPEIQSLSPQAVITAKTESIPNSKIRFVPGNVGYIVDDFCFSLQCQNGFPGTLVKWFEDSFSTTDYGASEYNNICKLHNNFNATFTVSIGLFRNFEINTFSHTLEGVIVTPRLGIGKGSYTVFVPNGSDKTLSEMTHEERNTISPRGKCFQDLQKFLNS